MMGAAIGRQDRLSYAFDLETMVPEDHLLRRIDAVLDLSWLREELKPYYSTIGRPSVCPELMIRMLLVGYCYSIRSERQLCQEVEFNLAYRWFCRLGLEDRVPDHSTFSVNRHAGERCFADIGLDPSMFGTHSLRRTKSTLSFSAFSRGSTPMSWSDVTVPIALAA